MNTTKYGLVFESELLSISEYFNKFPQIIISLNFIRINFTFKNLCRFFFVFVIESFSDTLSWSILTVTHIILIEISSLVVWSVIHKNLKDFKSVTKVNISMRNV